MAGIKVSALTELAGTPADNDVFAMVDADLNITKKVTTANLLADALTPDGNLQYDPGTGTITANAFVGDGSGLTNVSASGINTTPTSSGTYFVLLKNSLTGNDSVNTDGNLVYDPASDTLSALNFSGDGSLLTNVVATTATSATNVEVTDRTLIPGTYYVHMGSETTGVDGVDVHTDVTYSQATKTLTIDKIALTNLPTSDPAIAGALWNNSGTINISAG